MPAELPAEVSANSTNTSSGQETVDTMDRNSSCEDYQPSQKDDIIICATESPSSRNDAEGHRPAITANIPLPASRRPIPDHLGVMKTATKGHQTWEKVDHTSMRLPRDAFEVAAMSHRYDNDAGFGDDFHNRLIPQDEFDLILPEHLELGLIMPQILELPSRYGTFVHEDAAMERPRRMTRCHRKRPRMEDACFIITPLAILLFMGFICWPPVYLQARRP
ncbi:hypothetical protein PG993_002966 [Apiospora rasikravindrae]|uniref:Uncharacterized protein n=1 Tax=Apiospora rasikravindrae TaxID=990691 RepID=A0ABR1TY64_9PEZI